MSHRNGPRTVLPTSTNRTPRWGAGRTHGLRSTYNDGCRCDPCTDADSAYQRDRYGSRPNQEWVPTEFDPAPWMAAAACVGLSPDLFFPARGDIAGLRAAKAVCASCPVRAECLTYALDAGEKGGVWGGFSEKQRRRMRVDPAARVIALIRISKEKTA